MFTCSKVVPSVLMMAVGACMMLSCSADKGRALPLYAIERTAYEDMLVVEGYTESVNSVNVNCPRDVDGTIIQIVENGTYVEAGDTVCIIEDTNIENNVENWRVDLEGMYAEMEKLKATQRLEYALLEAQVRNNEAETLLADADSLRMIYMSPTDRRIKELQLEKTRIQRTQLMRKLEVTKVVHRTDRMKLEKRIEWGERQLEKELQKQASLVLTAPKAGIAVVARRHRWSDTKWVVGDNIWNGRTVVTLPDFDNMKTMIYAQEAEFKRLHEGDKVTYTFDAMPGNQAWGTIKKLSPVGQARSSSAVKTFEVMASIDSILTPVDPGMSALCRVYLRHVPDTIVVPTISVFDKDSLKVVYVEHKGHFEERQVTLGESSPRSTIIAEGLAVGERIALIKPSEKHRHVK